MIEANPLAWALYVRSAWEAHERAIKRCNRDIVTLAPGSDVYPLRPDSIEDAAVYRYHWCGPTGV